jgi:hypothetical protein
MKKTVRTIEITFADTQKIVTTAEKYGERIMNDIEAPEHRPSDPYDEVDADPVQQSEADRKPGEPL